MNVKNYEQKCYKEYGEKCFFCSDNEADFIHSSTKYLAQQGIQVKISN